MSTENATDEVWTETNDEATDSEQPEAENESKIDQYQTETITALIFERSKLQIAEEELEDAKAETKEAKIHVDAIQLKLNRLVDDLARIQNGNYQPLLAFPEDEPVEDPGKTTTIANLDITPSQIEKLNEAEIETVAQLEEAIGHGKIQNISGIGEKAIDRISDSVLKWREEYPVPEPVIRDPAGNEFAAEELIDDAKEKLSEESEA